MPSTQLSAFHPSPKRKRDNPPNVPLLNAATLNAASTPTGGSPEPSGPDSPGNAVADRLRGMTIAGFPVSALPAPPLSPTTPTDDIMRKKPKLEAMDGASDGPLDDNAHLEKNTPQKKHAQDYMVAFKRMDFTREIPETPQSVAPTRAPRNFVNIDASSEPMIFTSLPSNKTRDQQSTDIHDTSKSKDHTPQPRSRQKSPSPPLPSLTWQVNEITGHLADPSTDPDDDGTGINGIGFRPTPAIAYARAQKRRQQLLDWRARETKEARTKRSERRRRGTGGAGTPSREGTVDREMAPMAKETDSSRRAVRFAV